MRTRRPSPTIGRLARGSVCSLISPSSSQQPGDERAGDDRREAEHRRSQHVEGGQAVRLLADEGDRLEGVGRERRVGAAEAGGQDQPPGRLGDQPVGQERQDEADEETARHVDDQRAVGEGRPQPLRDPEADEVAGIGPGDRAEADVEDRAQGAGPSCLVSARAERVGGEALASECRGQAPRVQEHELGHPAARRAARMKGMPTSSRMTETTIKAGSEKSYSTPINALPRNQARPYPVLKMPYAEPRRSPGTIPAIAARITDSCTPIPMPQSATPSSASAKPPRNTNGAKSAETMVSGTSTISPARSNHRPNRSEPSPLTPIATA